MVKTHEAAAGPVEPMQLALAEARRAGERGEVPVGAVIVGSDGVILAADGNRCIERHDPAGHAEMLVLRAAGKKLENYRLAGTTLYVTLEPCLMCAAAMVHARIERLVFGAVDPKAGAIVSQYNIASDSRLNHSFAVESGCLAGECSTLLKEFFQARRGR